MNEYLLHVISKKESQIFDLSRENYKLKSANDNFTSQVKARTLRESSYGGKRVNAATDTNYNLTSKNTFNEPLTRKSTGHVVDDIRKRESSSNQITVNVKSTLKKYKKEDIVMKLSNKDPNFKNMKTEIIKEPIFKELGSKDFLKLSDSPPLKVKDLKKELKPESKEESKEKKIDRYKNPNFHIQFTEPIPDKNHQTATGKDYSGNLHNKYKEIKTNAKSSLKSTIKSSKYYDYIKSIAQKNSNKRYAISESKNFLPFNGSRYD